MDYDLFLFLCSIIPKSFVSVLNGHTISQYSFDFYDTDDGIPMHFDIRSFFSHNGVTNSYVRYELYIDGDLISTDVKHVFDKKNTVPDITNKKITVSENMKTADKLELLLKMCSAKIIRQEIDSQKHHMLKSFMDGRNIHQS